MIGKVGVVQFWGEVGDAKRQETGDYHCWQSFKLHGHQTYHVCGSEKEMHVLSHN